MANRLAYRPSARADLHAIYRWISAQAGPDIALAYVLRIQDACGRLCDFPRRGTPRDDLAPGLRTLAFERKAVIAYFVEAETVRIARILQHGRDLGRGFGRADPP